MIKQQKETDGSALLEHVSTEMKRVNDTARTIQFHFGFPTFQLNKTSAHHQEENTDLVAVHGCQTNTFSARLVHRHIGPNLQKNQWDRYDV
jgi:hypothetical protein